MLSVHNCNYVFTVLVSIFIRKTSGFGVASRCWYMNCFYYLHMHIVNDTYHMHMYTQMNLCLQHCVSALHCRDKNLLVSYL